MNFAIGVFDLFAYTIPGALYLAFFGYLGAKLHLLTAASIAGVPTVVVVIVLVLLSFLLGYLAYPLGDALNRVVPHRRPRSPHDEFLRRNPTAQGRAFVHADPHLLLCALQMHDKEVADDIPRQRASGLMLRNCALPFLLGSVAAIVEIFTGRHPFVAAGCAVLFLAGSVTFITQSRKFARWATLKTLELCFWLPEIDERLAADDATRKSA